MQEVVNGNMVGKVLEKASQNALAIALDGDETFISDERLRVVPECGNEFATALQRLFHTSEQVGDGLFVW